MRSHGYQIAPNNLRKAHDDLIAAAFRAKADALEIEALANRRLADEYDAAQERGEVATSRDGGRRSKLERLPTAADIGLNRAEIHEARAYPRCRKARSGRNDVIFGLVLRRDRGLSRGFFREQ
jgi:hypothetical protein